MAARSDAPRFVVVGRYIADCIANAARLPSWGETRPAHSVRMAPGGKALNQAVALARQGAHVTAVGAIGDDALGRGILETLAREGVDVIGIEVRPGANTPVCMCIIGDEGETAFLWNIGEDVVARPETVRRAAAAIAEADTMLITFEVSSETIHHAIAIAHRSGSRVVVHPGPTNHDVDHSALPWDHVDVLVPNEREARTLLGTRTSTGPGEARANLARAVARRTGVSTVVVTLGEDGCAVDGPDLSAHFPADADAQVADTMGASDAFTATLALRLTAGAPLAESVHEAQQAAAWTIGRRGGYESTPRACS
jgi:ribokinase